ncbi:short-chain dehydrogenase/reductase SDR [Calothrix sp. NIES-4071]|nr:short-chain dehydrogenase/reductase SDR [Calothrix sp. NIES-4071]BAZ57310.1 short-chain dehydrogenase/reductase SDR [Calothrix sp. NIES-4105]
MTQSDLPLIALVTGANRGIGLEVTRQLAKQGITVILGARDFEKGKAAAETLVSEGLQVIPKKLDVVLDRALLVHIRQYLSKMDKGLITLMY